MFELRNVYDTIKYQKIQNKFRYSYWFSVHDLVSIWFYIIHIECTNKISVTPDQAPTFAKLEMISLPSTLA